MGNPYRFGLVAVLFLAAGSQVGAQQREPFEAFAARNGIARPERYHVGGGEYFLPMVTGVDTATRTVNLGGYLPRTGEVTFRWDDYREWVARDGAFTAAHLSRRFDASLPVRFVVVSWTGSDGEERSFTLYAWLDRANPAAVSTRRASLGPGLDLVVSERVAQLVAADPESVVRTRTAGGRSILDILGERFPEVFDFVFLAPGRTVAALPASAFTGVSNDTRGTGLAPSADPRHPEVRGIVTLGGAGSYSLGWSLLCREMLRAWANYAVSTGMSGQWGFSTVWGKLGGMNPDTLRDLGGGRYEVDYFVPGHNSWVPYSPLELYFMGLAGASEVKPIRVFEGARVVDETPEIITFTATGSRVVTIEDIIAAHGARSPAYPDAPRAFRAIAVVVTDAVLDAPTLTQLESALAAFSLDRPLVFRYDYDELNFSAATRGRATIRLDGLAELFLD